MAVTGLLLFRVCKEYCKNALSNVTYGPSHRQNGAQMINIQSTLRTAPYLFKNVSLWYYLVTTLIHTSSPRSQICVCVCVYVYVYIYIYIYIHTHTHIHMVYTIQRRRSSKRNKLRTSVNVACQGNIPAWRFGHASHRFCTPNVFICIHQYTLVLT